MVPFVARREPRGNGAEVYADHVSARLPVASFHDTGLEPLRRGDVHGVGRAPGKQEAHYDLSLYMHSDQPWASDVEGRADGAALIKWVFDVALMGTAQRPAVQDARGAAGAVHPFVDRINLRNPTAGSFGAAIEAVNGGENIYFPGRW